jgi:thioredoxin-like negative regulator of GroEL
MAAKKIIKFYATWCGPCKVYNKVWEKVVPAYKDQIDVINIDIDKDTSGFAAKYKVESVPTTVLIREDGSEIKKSGRLSANELTELILS